MQKNTTSATIQMNCNYLNSNYRIAQQQHTFSVLAAVSNFQFSVLSCSISWRSDLHGVSCKQRTVKHTLMKILRQFWRVTKQTRFSRQSLKRTRRMWCEQLRQQPAGHVVARLNKPNTGIKRSCEKTKQTDVSTQSSVQISPYKLHTGEISVTRLQISFFYFHVNEL